jgi:hypothetical protein
MPDDQLGCQQGSKDDCNQHPIRQGCLGNGIGVMYADKGHVSCFLWPQRFDRKPVVEYIAGMPLEEAAAQQKKNRRKYSRYTTGESR